MKPVVAPAARAAGGPLAASIPRSGELLGALNATAVLCPMVAGWGIVAFGSAGAGAPQIGVTAALVAAVLGAVVYLWLSRAAMPAGAPSSSSALLLGACVAQLVQDPALQPATPGGAAMLVAATGLTVVGCGLLLVLLGLLRAGALVRFVPQPVLAGFMNGVAVLMVVSQLPAIAGVPAAELARQGWSALVHWQGAALAATVATALVMGGVAWRWPRAPAGLFALVLGTAAAWGMQAVCAASEAAAACTLQTFGSIAAVLPQADPARALVDASVLALLARHGPTLATTALLLALICGLESALNLAALDQRFNRRTDVDRELMALGAANVAGGLLGGLPLIVLRLRALATSASGGGRLGVALSCALLALVFALAMRWLAAVPLAVVAGIVVVLAWGLVDHWTRQLVVAWWGGERTADLQWSLVIAATVCAITVAVGFVAGVAAGVLLSMLIFIRALNRSLVRLRYSAATVPSRRLYAAATEERLRPLRHGIEVLELEGALFFGNVERLAQEVAQGVSQGASQGVGRGAKDALAGLPASAAPPPALPARRFLVLDLRRVSTIDASGAVSLKALRDRLEHEGTTLLLAGVTADNRHGRSLQAQGVLPSAASDAVTSPLHADTDRAIEAAERALLHEAGCDLAGLAVPPACNMLLEGLSAEDLDAVVPRLPRRRLAAGERLFGEGDAGDAIYLLTEGSVSMLDGASGQRFVSFSPGMCFGETAVLDGRGRTADARADEDSTLLVLPATLLEELQRHNPVVAAGIYRNLALHLSERLRGAAEAWRLAAG